MERRQQSRIEINQPVRLTVLAEPPEITSAVLVNLCGGGVQLRSPIPVPLNAAVKVELHDALLLGEVCYCQSEGESEDNGSTWLVGLITEQVLSNLSELSRLVLAIMGEESRPRCPAEPSSRK